MKNTRALAIAALTAASLSATLPAQAGGPLAVFQTGRPYVWVNGGVANSLQPRPGRPRSAGQRRRRGPDDRRVPGLG